MWTAHCKSSRLLYSRITVFNKVKCRCEDESIDELAEFLGVGQQVAEMTAKYVSNVQIVNGDGYADTKFNTITCCMPCVYRMHLQIDRQYTDAEFQS